MDSCLFCKIVTKQLPNYTVYEDANVLAFLDIHPCSKGHTVVVLKNHYSVVSDMNEADWAALNSGLKNTVHKIKTILNPDGMNIGINDGAAAGQAVPHVHWHIIPRYAHDGGGSMHSIVRQQNPIDVSTLAHLFL